MAKKKKSIVEHMPDSTGTEEDPKSLNGEAHNEKKDTNEGQEKTKKPETVSIRRLFSHADKLDVVLIIFGCIGAIGNGVIRPLSMIVFGQMQQKFIDHERRRFPHPHPTSTTVAGAGSILEDQMREQALLYVYIALGTLVFSFLQTGLWSLTAVRQVNRIRRLFFRSVLKQDIGWFDVNEASGITSRLSDDLIKIQSGLGEKVGLAINGVAMFLGGFIVGFVYSWKLSLVILACALPIAVLMAAMGKVRSTITAIETDKYSGAASVATEVLSSIRTVVAFGGEHEEIQRYEQHLELAEKAGVKKAFIQGCSSGGFWILLFSSYAFGLWYGAKLVMEKDMKAQDMMITIFSLMSGAIQLGAFVTNWQYITTAQGAGHFVYNLCEKEPVINCMSDEGDTMEDVLGDVKFENIQFSYPSREEIQVLKNFTLDVKHGTTVALVGDSGCGKSTIVKLLQRFYDPTAGHVRLDGTSLRDLNLKWFRAKIGVVSQEPVLFEMSIADNIKLGVPEQVVSMQRVEDAAKKANAHDFIMTLPEKYDTYVGEGGAQLSGGQKQRIAIARALIRDPKILLFDEATSALDTESEGIVQAALDKASEGRTTIIIAHRLSTVRNADVIVFVRNGEVVETGRHKELMEKGGFYYQLVVLQTVVEEVEEVDDEDGVEEDEIVRRKLMRTMSTMSSGSENSNIGSLNLESLATEVKRRKSIRKQKSVVETTSKKEEEKEDDIEAAPYLRIVKYCAPEWHYLLIGCFFAAIAGCFPIFFSSSLGSLFESFAKSPAKMKEGARRFALYFFGMGLAIGLSTLGSEVLFGKASEKLTKRMRKITFESLVGKDVGYFDDPKNSSGKVCAILASDASNVNSATGAQFQTISKILVMAVAALGIGFYYSWKLTLAALAVVPLMGLAGALQTKIFGNQAVEEGKKLNLANALANQLVSSIKTVASLGKEIQFVEKFNSLIEKPYREAKRNSWLFGLSFGFSGSMPMFAQAGLFVLGAKLVVEDGLKYGDMLMVYMAITFGSQMAGNMTAMTPDLMKGKVSAARIFRILDYLPKIDSFSIQGKTKESKDISGNISFNNINFHYVSRPGVTVLQDFSLDIKAGQKIALVGASGCGKSTTVALLERFYDAQSGNITLDGSNVDEFNIQWWRSLLGLVSQEPVLFARSIRDNITYGMKEKPSEKEIEAAAMSSNIHSFIIGLPQGYDTLVGEKGSLISGGQKQRIAIARALVRNPKVMLLDEATSALDSESERVVQEALDAAMVGRTSIIIAHRLSTIQNADLIVVMQTGGKVAEIGTHQELVAKQGVYYQLNKTHVAT